MAYEVLTHCPVCSNDLTITRLKCKKCQTTIENEFKLSKLASLKKEQLDFIEVFLKCRGNIKEVEKELNVSYPTVRGKLDDVVRAIGGPIAKQENESKSIVEQLEKGEISIDDALRKMKK
ncbi:MAG: DUF2089 domain-containing protein [Bacillaceae bacterium]